MSWLFGVKKQNVPEISGEELNDRTNVGSGEPQLSKAEKKAMEAYRFDSSALERAAEAAKTLEKSSK